MMYPPFELHIDSKDDGLEKVSRWKYVNSWYTC